MHWNANDQFEYLAAKVGVKSEDLLFFYGSLMKDHDGRSEIGPIHEISYLQGGELDGHLYDLDAYPGATPGDHTVYGELWRINSDANGVLARLDEFERFDAAHPETSLFVRRLVRLRRPQVDAWVYWFAGDIEGHDRIDSGIWRPITT